MFEIQDLKRAAASLWANDAVLQAVLRNDNSAWLRRVEKLEHCPRMGASEFDLVRGLRDSITGGSTGNSAVPLSKLPMDQLARLIATAPLTVPAASISAAPATGSRASAAPAGVRYETEEQTLARAAAEFRANSPAGAQLRSDFAGNLGTYQAYEVAKRHKRVRIMGGGVKTYQRGANV